jgi:cobalamin biosynthesis Mg chelatase CobN
MLTLSAVLMLLYINYCCCECVQDEVKEVLAADPTLAAEIEYDLKQFEKEDSERKKKLTAAAAAATATATVTAASPTVQATATSTAVAASSSSGTAAASGSDSANDKSSSAMGPPATPSARSKARLSGKLLLFVMSDAAYLYT